MPRRRVIKEICCHCKYCSHFLTKGISLAVPTEKRVDPLDYFRMGIIEELSFFLFNEEDPVRLQKFWERIM